MNVAELRRRLASLPDDMPVVIDYAAGCCREEEVGVWIDGDLLVLDTDPDHSVSDGNVIYNVTVGP